MGMIIVHLYCSICSDCRMLSIFTVHTNTYKCHFVFVSDSQLGVCTVVMYKNYQCVYCCTVLELTCNFKQATLACMWLIQLMVQNKPMKVVLLVLRILSKLTAGTPFGGINLAALNVSPDNSTCTLMKGVPHQAKVWQPPFSK